MSLILRDIGGLQRRHNCARRGGKDEGHALHQERAPVGVGLTRLPVRQDLTGRARRQGLSLESQPHLNPVRKGCRNHSWRTIGIALHLLYYKQFLYQLACRLSPKQTNLALGAYTSLSHLEREFSYLPLYERKSPITDRSLGGVNKPMSSICIEALMVAMVALELHSQSGIASPPISGTNVRRQAA